MDEVRDEINEKIEMNKTTSKFESRMPSVSSLKLTDDGSIHLTLVFVSLHYN